MTFSEIPHHNLPTIKHNSRDAIFCVRHRILIHKQLHHLLHLKDFGVKQIALHGGVP